MTPDYLRTILAGGEGKYFRSGQPEQRERLLPTERILLPQPTFLITYATHLGMASIINSYGQELQLPKDENKRADYLEKIAQADLASGNSAILRASDVLTSEYDQVRNTIGMLVGQENIVLVRNASVEFYRDPVSKKPQYKVREDFAELSTHPTIALVNPMKDGEIFVRDAFMKIGPFTFMNPQALRHVKETDTIIKSPLGEGGKVLSSGKVVLLSEELEGDNVANRHVKLLRQNGYRVAYLPLPRPRNQPLEKQTYHKKHIDGHASLVLPPDTQDPILVFAKSYAEQGGKARRAILDTAKKARIQTQEIDDKELPHLAFNFIQFNDGTVLIPGSGQTHDYGTYKPSELENFLVKLLGKKTHRIPGPLKHIASSGGGGIRCLTNVAPTDVLEHVARNV